MIASRRSLSQAAFVNKIDVMTHTAIADGATTFETLLRRLPAVYPTEVLASLDRLATRGAIPVAVAYDARRQAGRNSATSIEGRSLLPLPHPLDFEWRFTPDAARALLNRATCLTPADGDLLLFWTPGLAVEALTLPIGRRLCSLPKATGSPTASSHSTMQRDRRSRSPSALAGCLARAPTRSSSIRPGILTLSARCSLPPRTPAALAASY